MTELPHVPDAAERRVPAHRLRASTHNVRRTRKDANVEALADSIRHRGLLHNLVVSVAHEPDGEVYPVEAGERRRLAIALLVERGHVPADWPVRVCLVADAERTAASAAENHQREPMHPADQVEVFGQLLAEGWSVDRIADEHSVTPLVVERRLRLAAAAPSLKELLRADGISTEQLAALCATDDHARQEEAWRSAPSWDRSPAALRRRVLAGEVPTSDPRVAFIGGVEAYLAAGGEVRRDLFTDDGGGALIADLPLLTRLVTERLEEAADAVRAEGWSWVEVWPAWDAEAYYRLGRIDPVARPMDAETESRLASLYDELALLEGEADANAEGLVDEEGGAPEAGSDEDAVPEAAAERLREERARMEAVHTEIAGIEAAHVGYEQEMMAASGAVVLMAGRSLRVERGLVRAADREAAARAVGAPGGVMGGRETRAGGRRPDELSDALARSLLGYRNAAAQEATARNPHVAKTALACWAVQTIRVRHAAQVPVDLRISDAGQGTRTHHPITDDGGEAARAGFERLCTELLAPLPADPERLWDALLPRAAADLDALVALGVAASVSLERDHTGLTARLLDALGFDMADHFVPTAANYLGRVSKGLILSALTEAGEVENGARRTALLGLKKGDLAAEAETSLARSRWVPALIRTPGTRREPAEPHREPGADTMADAPEEGVRAAGTAPLAEPAPAEPTRPAKAARPPSTGSAPRTRRRARAPQAAA